jgi:hypothetical protein
MKRECNPTIKKHFSISKLFVGAKNLSPLPAFAILAMLLAVPAYAQTNPTTVPHNFKAGEDASADQVNKNFTTMADGINEVKKEVDDIQKGITIDSAGNVGIGTTGSPGAKLEVGGDLIRTISRAHGNGPNDTTGNGQIVSRLLSFTKKRPDTGIRVTYTDNFRVAGDSVSGSWEIRFSGVSCKNPGPLRQDRYMTGNSHDGATVVSTCFGLSEGPVLIGIWVATPVPGHAAGALWTGWNNSYWSLEAEEVR